MLLGGDRRGIAHGDDDIDMARDELLHELGQTLGLALRGPALEGYGLAVDIAEPGEIIDERGAQETDIGRAGREKADARNLAPVLGESTIQHDKERDEREGGPCHPWMPCH